MQANYAKVCLYLILFVHMLLGSGIRKDKCLILAAKQQLKGHLIYCHSWVINLITQIHWVFFTARPWSDLTCCKSWSTPIP